jgi:hypothetical protein
VSDWYAPNQQAVRPDGSGPAEEGAGAGTGPEPAKAKKSKATTTEPAATEPATEESEPT